MSNWKINLENELKLKGHSKKTIKAYCYHVNKFFESKLHHLCSSKSIYLYFLSLQELRSNKFTIIFLNVVTFKKFSVKIHELFK